MVIFIDGSCIGNGTLNAKAGWGFIAYDGVGTELARKYGKVSGNQTNNRAEIMSLVSALRFVNTTDCNKTITIKSDSKLVVECSKGLAQRKANIDLWKLVEDEVAKLNGKNVVIEQIPRKDNFADGVAKQGCNSLF